MNIYFIFYSQVRYDWLMDCLLFTLYKQYCSHTTTRCSILSMQTNENSFTLNTFKIVILDSKFTNHKQNNSAINIEVYLQNRRRRTLTQRRSQNTKKRQINSKQQYNRLQELYVAKYCVIKVTLKNNLQHFNPALCKKNQLISYIYGTI